MTMSWGQLGNKLYKAAKLNRVPISGQFELTARCNLHCKMCYICRNSSDTEVIKRERTAEEWLSMAREARDAGMLYLLLTGGEIFLRKDFMYIYSELVKMGFHIELYTNATMITAEIAKELGRIPPSKVGVTIYGASPETYERVCGNANGFELAMRGIDLLMSQGIKVWVKTTVVKGNVEDFDRISSLAEERGIEFGTISYISPRREGDGTSPEGERLSPSELVNFRRHVGEYFSSKKSRTLESDAIVESTDKDSIKKELDTSNVDAFDCVAGKCAFWITWDGKMTPCALMSEPYYNPFENGFKNAWSDIQAGCNSIPICTSCNKCAHKEECMPCPARLKIETGSYDTSAPYLCEIMNMQYVEKEVSIDEEIH